MKRFWIMLLALGILGLPNTSQRANAAEGPAVEKKQDDTRIFELRIYHVHPGKLPALNARFKDHTNKLLEKHGMKLIGFWTPTDPKQAGKTLYYLVAHASREAADKSWGTFRNDPDWKAAKEASEKDGPLVEKVDSIFMTPTEYSALK